MDRGNELLLLDSNVYAHDDFITASDAESLSLPAHLDKLTFIFSRHINNALDVRHNRVILGHDHGNRFRRFET